MNVVVRGVQAAAMGVYAALHIQQAINPPDGAPTWLTVAFFLASIAALGLVVSLITFPDDKERLPENGAALLAVLSLGALALSYTTGFFGVDQAQLRAETAIVFVAEIAAIGGWVISRAFKNQPETQEVSSSRRDSRVLPQGRTASSST